MSNFQTRFKQLRLDANLTQVELAKELGISRSTVGMYETGERNPDSDTLELIADYFNVDLDFLLGRTNKTTRLLGFTYTSEALNEPIFIEIIERISSQESVARLHMLELLKDYLNCDDFSRGRISTLAEMLAESSEEEKEKTSAPPKYRGKHEELVEQIAHEDREEAIEEQKRKAETLEKIKLANNVDKEAK